MIDASEINIIRIILYGFNNTNIARDKERQFQEPARDFK